MVGEKQIQTSQTHLSSPSPSTASRVTLGQWLAHSACVFNCKGEGVGNAGYESLGLHCRSAAEGRGKRQGRGRRRARKDGAVGVGWGVESQGDGGKNQTVQAKTVEQAGGQEEAGQGQKDTG